ncbi:putative peptidase [Aspergillus taichungensis]|uniref:Putative peptidase n=1 Tax=Aspergillus taichungensis TaxID=482145 RepID=A0A2J5I8J6_9EURO|nr:putative peptidase [Aspergillus taichungensis]
MFRPSVTQPLVRRAPLSFFTPSAFLPARPPPANSPFSFSRALSTSTPSRLFRSSNRPFQFLVQSSHRGHRRPFSSAGSRWNRYQRFGNDQRPVFVESHNGGRTVIILVCIGGAFYAYNLEDVEMTGRRRFNCFSHAQELKVGMQSYEELLEENRGHILPYDHPLSQKVDAVLQRLIPVAPLEGASWRVHVIDDINTPNAFVLPGGKVFVYTGILPYCQNEDGLAAVLGHEIAHVLAHHPAERMSNSLIAMVAAMGVSFLFDISGQIPAMMLSLVYRLPNSRVQEAEADSIGLTLMAKACFNPEEAYSLWSRMEQREGTEPPQFLSTHPSNYNRMESIREQLIKAQSIYEDSGCQIIGGFVPDFHDAYSRMS